jgi:hypothetical protein
VVAGTGTSSVMGAAAMSVSTKLHPIRPSEQAVIGTPTGQIGRVPAGIVPARTAACCS